MLIALPADWKLMLAMGGAALAAVAMIVYAFLRPEGDPEAEERRRRLHLNQIGRIPDGTVIDVQEITPNGHPAATMLIFQYDVGGVSYEASQDVTYLRQWVNLHSCRLGLPTSVRYDPQNGAAHLAVSGTGTLVYSPAPAASAEYLLAWVDTAGRVTRVSDTPRTFREPRLSPDGRRVAVVIGRGTDADLWILDIATGTLTLAI